MEQKEDLNFKKQQDDNHKNKKSPNKEKAYPVRNFFKELKRISWPTKKNNYKYFFFIFVFIIFLVVFFALISWGAIELIKWMGAS